MALKWQKNALKRLIISEFDEKHDHLPEYAVNTRVLTWMIAVLRDEIDFFIASLRARVPINAKWVLGRKLSLIEKSKISRQKSFVYTREGVKLTFW